MVWCEADKVFLCLDCDVSIHEVNPVARRHVRQPVVKQVQGELLNTEAPNIARGPGWGMLAAREDEASPLLSSGMQQGNAQKGSTGDQSDVMGIANANWPSLDSSIVNRQQGAGDSAISGTSRRMVNRNKPMSLWEVNRIQKKREELGRD